jgi:acetylornithine/succinyldiaminopimelate/putrescine aminotransferase
MGFWTYDTTTDFLIDKHYNKSLYHPGKHSDYTRGGQKLCLKAGTKKADSIQHGKIVSKSKSIDGIINNNFDAVNLRRRSRIITDSGPTI